MTSQAEKCGPRPTKTTDADGPHDNKDESLKPILIAARIPLQTNVFQQPARAGTLPVQSSARESC